MGSKASPPGSSLEEALLSWDRMAGCPVMSVLDADAPALGMRAWKQNGLRCQPGPFGPFPEGINHGRVILNEVRAVGPFPG